VLLSSHNMLEIEFLSDRVAIIAAGQIHATGTPEQLKAEYDAGNLEQVFAQIAEEQHLDISEPPPGRARAGTGVRR